MAKLMPQHIERHLAGLRAMTSHAERLYRQGELEHARTYALEQRFGPLSDAETYIAARQNGDFEKYEAIMNDPRSGTEAQREMVARKIAAHRVAETHLQTNYQNAADQEAWAKRHHEEVSKFIDLSESGDDPDTALIEAQVRLNLGEEVSKPKEVPSWSLPVQSISEHSEAAGDFYNRQAKTPGTKQWHDHHDSSGSPRNARTGKIEKAGDFKPLDYEPPKRDDDRGFSVDRERAVMSEAEHRELDNFEQSQAPEPAPIPEPPAPEQPVNF